mmetsp:Transcript_14348/g.36962  ORF Transcript_14348/g.36962 Transcript_14348/m.36962 type:complete len:112 (+) Transcript_14348:308-643(+)
MGVRQGGVAVLSPPVAAAFGTSRRQTFMSSNLVCSKFFISMTSIRSCSKPSTAARGRPTGRKERSEARKHTPQNEQGGAQAPVSQWVALEEIRFDSIREFSRCRLHPFLSC